MKTVALLFDDQKNAYQQLLVREARSAADELRIRLLEPRFADGSSWNQIAALNEQLRSETPPDAVVTLLVGGQLTRGQFERVARAGISVVLLNRVPSWTVDLQTQYPQVLVTAVTPRQEDVGRIQGQQARRMANDGALVILITGTGASMTAIARKQGFVETVEDHFDLRELDGSWTLEGAEQVLAKWFHIGTERLPQLIVCHNDLMAQGARMALEKEAARTQRPELRRVPLLGCDGLADEGRARVKRGEQAATVVLPTTARVAMDALARYWKSGEKSAIVELASTSFPELDALKPASGAGGGT
jgi:ABC-type sugar transport system substrate-binding protein